LLISLCRHREPSRRAVRFADQQQAIYSRANSRYLRLELSANASDAECLLARQRLNELPRGDQTLELKASVASKPQSCLRSLPAAGPIFSWSCPSRSIHRCRDVRSFEASLK